MRLTSVQALVSAGRRALVRFPAVLAVAVIAALAAIIGFESPADDFWMRLMGTAALAIPLYLAIDLLALRRGWSLVVRAGLWAVGAALLAGFMAAWFDWSAPVAFGRYAQLSVGFHLLVATSPFLGIRELQGFWQFNKTLFLRVLTAAIYTAVLFAGLAIALLAVDNLFGLDVAEETYGRLWFAMWFVVNTWIVLAGVPEDLPALERQEDYPAGLKVFAQYALVPLVAVYLVILTLYLGKVLITQVWPSGWIGWLVSSVAAAGIFSLLLVYPIAERAENRWMRTYAWGFYVALLPSIVMLWLAIWKRIDQYGVTERRYFLAVLSVWLAAVAVFYAVKRSRDIRIIPISLLVCALVTFGGPWGAYRISEASQIGRLEALLIRNGILQDGTIRPASGRIDAEDRREISAVLRYLIETHGTAGIAPWFGGALAAADTLGEGTDPSPGSEIDDRADLIARLMGVDYVMRWQSGPSGRFYHRMQWNREPLPTAGFDVVMRVDGFRSDTVLIGDDLLLRFDSAAVTLRVETSAGNPVLEFPLAPLLARADTARAVQGGRGLPPAVMRLHGDTPEIGMDIYVTSVSGLRSDDGTQVSSLDLQVLYALKR